MVRSDGRSERTTALSTDRNATSAGASRPLASFGSPNWSASGKWVLSSNWASCSMMKLVGASAGSAYDVNCAPRVSTELEVCRPRPSLATSRMVSPFTTVLFANDRLPWIALPMPERSVIVPLVQSKLSSHRIVDGQVRDAAQVERARDDRARQAGEVEVDGSQRDVVVGERRDRRVVERQRAFVGLRGVGQVRVGVAHHRPGCRRRSRLPAGR